MTTSPSAMQRPAGPDLPRRATRSSDHGYLGGVAAGLADHLGMDVTLVRALFVLTGMAGFGVLLYAGLWLVLPLDTAVAGGASRAPGLDSASRQGRRPGGPARAPGPGRLRDAGPVVALAAVVLGVAGLVNAFFGGPLLVWPAVVAVVGLMVLWRQADEAQRERWWDATGRVDISRVLLGGGGWAAWARLATGLGLLVVALVVFAVQTGDLGVAGDVVLAGVLGMVGLALTLGPSVNRLASDLGEERAARVRTQERADVAAHLHDSVLQTLALIQKNAGDAGQVARLARAQERDLRRWMYGEDESSVGTLTAGLREAAAEVEDAHGVPVEVVTVGDAPAGAVRALLAAAREAMTNAARHSGAAKVDVYAEVAGAAAEVFVRDRGAGFDPTRVPEDRLGVRRSILARMERHGGTAQVRSTPGNGTEIRLRMPVTPGEEER